MAAFAPRPRLEAFTYYERLAKIKQVVEASFPRTIPLNEAADVACLERKYFSRYFRAKVGVSFTAWQKALKIQRATEILRSHDESISRVASLVGFRSVRTFERAFKDRLGVPPAKYRNRMRP